MDEELVLEGTDPDAEEVADALATRILNGRKILDICESRILDGLRVDGRSLKQWGEELSIDVPTDNSDVAGLERALSQFSMAIQKAERLLAIFEVQEKISLDSHEQGFSRKYVSEMELHRGEKMAAEKLRHLVAVDKKVDSILAASQVAGVITAYFKRIVSGLTQAREALNNRVMTLGLRLKYLHDE